MKIEEYLQKQVRESTAKNYLYEINKFKLLNKRTATYDYQKIMEYVETIRQKNNPRTVERIIAAIKKYYDYLIETGKRKDNPVRAIKMRDAKDEAIQLQDLFTEKELQSLLVPRVERYPFLAKRNQIIISILVNQGLRTGEISQLKLEDINLEKAQLKVTGTGLTNSRTLPLKAEQILLIYEYINVHRIKLVTFRTKENYLLLSKLGTATKGEDIGYLISTYQKESFGNKTLTAGTIRQSVIANLLSKNNDLRMVQEFAGHKHLDTTEKYKETGLHALQTAIEKLHPIK
jgi:site-specific recombinase XerD